MRFVPLVHYVIRESRLVTTEDALDVDCGQALSLFSRKTQRNHHGNSSQTLLPYVDKTVHSLV
jgi:hypothetical protein